MKISRSPVKKSETETEGAAGYRTPGWVCENTQQFVRPVFSAHQNSSDFLAV